MGHHEGRRHERNRDRDLRSCRDDRRLAGGSDEGESADDSDRLNPSVNARRRRSSPKGLRALLLTPARVRVAGTNSGRVKFMRRAPLIERFESLYVPVTETGCWLWIGCSTTKGYGEFYWKRPGHHRTVFAHRASYAIRHGASPPAGMLVCHKCDTPSCVNPDHLFLGTALDNTRDMFSKGRERTQKASATCGRGHSIFRTRPDGRRYCVECHKIYDKKRPRRIHNRRKIK